MKALIYKPTKSAMQSGKAIYNHWILRFDQSKERYIEPVMGWTSSKDMNDEVELKFQTLEQALDYAKKHGIEVEVVAEKKKGLIIKAYADNFTS